MKIILDKNQSLEEAESILKKAIRKNRECSGKEQYSDPALNEFHDLICDEHVKLIKKIEKEILGEIDRYVSSKRSY